MEKSLIKDLYRGYISKEKNLLEKESGKLLTKCLKDTSRKLEISPREVKNSVYNLTSISRFSANVDLDYDTIKKLYYNYVHDKSSNRDYLH